MQESHEIFETEPIQDGNETLREFITFFRDIIIILLCVLFVRAFIVIPFRINGSSMESSYHDKEYILVDKVSYTNFPVQYGTASGSSWIHSLMGRLPIHIGDPKRGDVVVITPHVDKDKEYYIKRIIGMPGDIIRFESGSVYIKKPESETFVKIQEPYLSLANSGRTFLPESVEGNQFLIPEEYYWIMGDNRNNSADARSCFKTCTGKEVSAHFLSRKNILGKVLLDFWYFNIFDEGGLVSSGKMTWTHAPRFFNHPHWAQYPELWE